MRHLSAYLLLVVGGNATPSADDVTKVLATAGVEVDQARLDQLVAELEGKSVEELITLGRERLVVTGGAPSGGAPAAVATPGVFLETFIKINFNFLNNLGGATSAAVKAPEKPKEEEVDALDGGMDMFGGEKGGGDY